MKLKSQIRIVITNSIERFDLCLIIMDRSLKSQISFPGSDVDDGRGLVPDGDVDVEDGRDVEDSVFVFRRRIF